MANQYRTVTRDIASILRNQNVDAAALIASIGFLIQRLDVFEDHRLERGAFSSGGGGSGQRGDQGRSYGNRGQTNWHPTSAYRFSVAMVLWFD